MCETNAYLVEAGVEEMFMESIARLEVEGGTITLTGVFGDKKQINGEITGINFQGGKLMLRRLQA